MRNRSPAGFVAAGDRRESAPPTVRRQTGMVELAAGLSSIRLLGYRRLYSSARQLQKLSGHERDFFKSLSGVDPVHYKPAIMRACPFPLVRAVCTAHARKPEVNACRETIFSTASTGLTLLTNY